MSENIRSVLTDRRKNGFHIGAFALYGYKKDPEQKGHLIIAEEAAAVVREVFTLFSQGYGKTCLLYTSSIRERGQVPYGGTVAERASVPVVKAASIHHEQIPSARTERQILPPASPDKPEERQKANTAPVIPERKRATPAVKESNFTIRRTTAKKEWTKTVTAAAKQKKGEKPCFKKFKCRS